MNTKQKCVAVKDKLSPWAIDQKGGYRSDANLFATTLLATLEWLWEVHRKGTNDMFATQISAIHDGLDAVKWRPDTDSK